jgi:hypothetical protein
MLAVMYAYAAFAGILILVILTIAIAAGTAALVRRLRGKAEDPRPPES